MGNRDLQSLMRNYRTALPVHSKNSCLHFSNSESSTHYHPRMYLHNQAASFTWSVPVMLILFVHFFMGFWDLIIKLRYFLKTTSNIILN